MLSSLKDLYVSANKSSVNLENLKYLNSLQTSNITNINIINSNYLKNNKAMTSIDIKNSGLYSLEGIEKLTALGSAMLTNNNIKYINKFNSYILIELLDYKFSLERILLKLTEYTYIRYK